MPERAYTLDRPKHRTSSVVFASPHSGRDYPDWFLRRSVLNARSIRSSEDAFIDRLYDIAPELGAPLLRSGAPRAFIDYNRSADELDPALIAGISNSGKNPRVASGLGVIPRVVANGQPIYSGKIAMDEAQERLDKFWHPYHQCLEGLLRESHRLFGEAILVDCHSMPHEALDAVRVQGGKRPEIVLGDRFGAACRSEIMDQIEEGFVDQGFVVSRNSPFAGAFVTQCYGRPSRQQHAVQIEIDRSLYMDERRIQPSSDFRIFRQTLQKVITEIVEIGQAPQQMAAE